MAAAAAVASGQFCQTSAMVIQLLGPTGRLHGNTELHGVIELAWEMEPEQTHAAALAADPEDEVPEVSSFLVR